MSQTTAHLEPSPSARTGGISLRAVLVGVLMALFIGAVTPYTNMIIKGSLLAHNSNVPIALFTFFLFVLFVNVGFRLARRSYALDPSELATVYIMAMLATAIPTVGFSEYFLPITAGVYYYATVENDWANIIHPHIPAWIAPQDEEAVRLFFEGLPAGGEVPWEAWIEPIAYWCVLILSVFWVSTCMMVIMRKQWMENEKLLYPLVQVAIDMLRDDDRQSLIKPFFKNRVMWAGFAIPFLVGSCHALHFYYPFFPGMGDWTTRLAMFRDTTDLLVMFNLGVVGIAFLLNRDIALGLWVFFLIAHLERGLFNILGFESMERLSRFTFEGGPYLAHQTMGAMVVLVLSGVWMGRDHLKTVFRQAFRKAPDVDDSDEILPYRTATWGLFLGTIVIGVWLAASGLPWWIVPVFLFAAFIIFLALTRATVEGGMPHIRTPLTATDFVVSGLGTNALGTAGVISLGFTYVWAANLRIFFMVCVANGLKVAEQIKGRKRPLIWAVALAAIAALAGSMWSILKLSYAYGGINLQQFFFVSVPQQAGMNMAAQLANPTSPDLGGWLFTGLGALVMGILTWVRVRFMWWPIHPLGFAVTEYRLMSFVWFSVLVAWIIKSAVLKYGGPTLYNRSRPFFLGLVLGQICVTGTWLIIDHFTGKNGNLPLPWHSSFV